MHLATRASWLLVNMLVAASVQAAVSGRPVSEVLDELRSQHLTFIYNSDIVPPNLRVREEPRAQAGVELAEEVLAGCGLKLMPIAPGIYSVVPATSSPVPAAPVSPTGNDVPLEEVVVQTSRYRLATDSANDVSGSNEISRQQLETVPRLANEPLRALQRLPGVSTNGFSSLGSVRGGLGNETVVVLDDLRLYEPFHLKNFLAPVSLLDSQVIDGIEFYSGGFPAIYGDALSGVVDAKTVHPTQPKYFELGLDIFHSSGLASAQLTDNTRGLLAVRRSNLGDIARLSERDFGELHYGDGLARFEYKVNPDTQASVQTLISEDEVLGRRDENTEQISAHYHNAYTWLTLEHQWSAAASSRLMASSTTIENQRRGFEIDPGERMNQLLDDREFQIVGLRFDHQLQTGAVRQRLGVEMRWLTGRYDYASTLMSQSGFPFPGSPASTTTRTSNLRPSGQESAVYWDGLAELSSRWSVQGGLRGESQSYEGASRDSQLSPRVSVLYRATPQTRLRASWGRFFQPQGINELQVEDGIETRNSPQYADHSILALEHSFTPGFDLRLEAYHKSYRHLSPRFENLFDPVVLFPEAEPDRVRVDAESARANGVELLLQAQPSSAWRGWFNYAWARAEDNMDGRYVPRTSDQRESVNAGIVWTPRNWTVSLADTFHTGTPTTPLSLLTQPTGPVIDIARRNSQRLGHFNSLDLRVVHQFSLPVGSLDAYVEVSNLLNRDNPCCVEYSVTAASDGSLRNSRQVDSTLPRIPTVGVTWRFE